MISSATKRRLKGRSSRKWKASSRPSTSWIGSATTVMTTVCSTASQSRSSLEQARVVQEALEVGDLVAQAEPLEADDHRVEEREMPIASRMKTAGAISRYLKPRWRPARAG